MTKAYETVRRTMSQALIFSVEVKLREKACLTKTTPDTLEQAKSGTERGRELQESESLMDGEVC